MTGTVKGLVLAGGRSTRMQQDKAVLAYAGAIALADLVVFTRQLATMIDAGLAIVQSLQALAEQTSNKIMRDVIRDMGLEISEEQFQRILSRARAAVASNYDTHYLTVEEFETICRGVVDGGRG